MAGAHTVADYAAAILAHLPRGRIWGDDDGPQSRLMEGLAAEPARLDRRALELLHDAFPANAAELLAEWEETLGLPDLCSGAGATLQERRAAVVGKLVAVGGQSVPHYVALAAAFGFAVEIEEFAPFRAGLNRIGSPLQGDAWAHHFRIHAPEQTITDFRAGRSAVGEPLRAWGNAPLECVIRRAAPAHATVSFAYDL